MKTLIIFVAVAVSGAFALAQAPSKPLVNPAGLGKSGALSNEELNTRAYIELLRRDVKKLKTEVMGDIMQLDADQATKFWPIYKEFETEYSALGNQVVAVVRKYADSYDRMTDTIADQLANQALSIEEQRNELKKKYYARMKSELGAIMATRFLQVENQLERLVDLQVTAQLPVIAHR
jgi:dsDNA-binding SOS-regulon protein